MPATEDPPDKLALLISQLLLAVGLLQTKTLTLFDQKNCFNMSRRVAGNEFQSNKWLCIANSGVDGFALLGTI